jgi:hypothetical protein
VLSHLNSGLSTFYRALFKLLTKSAQRRRDWTKLAFRNRDRRRLFQSVAGNVADDKIVLTDNVASA